MLCIESTLSMPWHLPCDYYHARRKGVITNFWLISSCPRCTLKICRLCVWGSRKYLWSYFHNFSLFLLLCVYSRPVIQSRSQWKDFFIFMGHTINDHQLWSTLLVKRISIYYLSLILWAYLDFYERIRSNKPRPLARVFLLRQLWIVNYYVKSSVMKT